MKFSVVINTFNNANLLPGALQSVAQQRLPDFELLVVDDGSSDGTGAVVEEFRESFPRCQYLLKPHTQLADSRNFAMRHTSGEWIAFLDSDDRWHAEYLEKLDAVIAAHPSAELVGCNGYRFRADGRLVETLFPSRFRFPNGPLDRVVDEFSFFPYLTPSGTIFKRVLFDRVGEFDLRYPLLGHDWKWLVQAIHAGARCVAVDEKLVRCYGHDSNLTLKADDMFTAWLNVYQEVYPESERNAELQSLASDLALQCFRSVPLRCSGSRCRELLRPAIQLFPKHRMFRVYYSASYLGLSTALRFAWKAKRAVRAAVAPPSTKPTLVGPTASRAGAVR